MSRPQSVVIAWTLMVLLFNGGGGALTERAGQDSSASALPFPLRAPEGLRIELVSDQVRGARFIAVAPNGDVLVAMIGQGTVVAVSPGSRVDAQPRVVARGLSLPNAVLFRNNDLYIAGWTGISRIADYPHGKLETLVNDLPRNHGHNNRALALDGEGALFVSSGSSCNVCEEDNPLLATILRYPANGGRGRIYASGLRNASGLAFDAQGQLWAVVNQRDNLYPDHTDLPPDELDRIQEGGNYGWPYAYPDGRLRVPNPEFSGVSTDGFLPTTLNLPAHSAPLQIAFNPSGLLGERYRGALFIAYHGSWNRSPPTGYKVVAVSFAAGLPVAAEDFVSGWLDARYRVLGRPVGVAFAPDGALYISDDTGYLFRVSGTAR